MKLKAIWVILISKYYYVAGSNHGKHNGNIYTVGNYTAQMAYHIAIGMIDNGTELVKEEAAVREVNEILNTI
jgi:hypothetical protein